MKYYVIINGESSLDIQGLAIESLPAISKPLMRSKREEIDGRNGDIITQLGYGAYDKTLKIGLWGDYDINEVITFFNQDGIITFSNEPDMYYNFTILNRIDFINQLEAFRKATITIHCQPFKYKEEETEELEIITKEVSGTDISVNDAVDGAMDITLKGNTSQVQLSGKNKFNYNNIDNNAVSISSDGTIVISGITSTSGYCYTNKTLNQLAPSLQVGDEVYLYLQTDWTLREYIYISDGSYWYNTGKKTITQEMLNGFVIIYGGYNTTSHLKIMITTSQDVNFEQYCGGIPSPNPSYPQDIHNVSGNNSIVVCGKNLFDKDKSTLNYTIYANGSGGEVSNLTDTSDYIPVKANTTYRLSYDYSDTPSPNYRAYCLYDNTKTYLSGASFTFSNKYNTFTPTQDGYIRFSYPKIFTDVMFIKGNQVSTYEAYQSQTYPINLPNGMELCKIGDYKDYFYKDSDKWYLHKEIGYKVLNGTEDWKYSSSNQVFYVDNWLDRVVGSNEMYYDYFNVVPINTSYANMVDGNTRIDTGTNGRSVFKFSTYTSANDFKNWLSTHNVKSYYQLATPTNTEITDTTLIEQLNAIKSANSYYGTTNINQVNNDMPFILDVSYLSGTDNITITNHGNYYSKPKLTLTGTGNIGIYLNDSQIFQVALGTDETIIIDTDKMEAYYESTLKNRQVIGDYNSFKLLSGENTIKISGTFSKLQVDNYSRWI